MADETEREDADGSGQRSGRYPSVALKEALEKAQMLYKAEKLSPVTSETAATKMGYKGMSGAARATIGALRQYGLIEKTGTGQFRLSKLANEAMHATDEQKVSALKRAAVSPPLFAELAKTHLDASEENIKSHLQVNKDFIDTGARIAAQTFRETIKFANVTASGYSTGNDGNRSEDKGPSNGGKPDMEQQRTDALGGKTPTPNDGVFALNVPFAKGSIAVNVRVSGQPISRAALARVRQYIELAEQDLDTTEN